MRIYHLWMTLFVNTVFPIFLLLISILNLGIFGFTFIHGFIGFLILLVGCIEILVWNQSIRNISNNLPWSGGSISDFHIYDKPKWFKIVFPFIKYGLGLDLYQKNDHYILVRKFHPTDQLPIKEIFPKVFIERIKE